MPYIAGVFPEPILQGDQFGNLRGVQPKPPSFTAPRLPQPSTSTTPAKSAQPKAPPTTAPVAVANVP